MSSDWENGRPVISPDLNPGRLDKPRFELIPFNGVTLLTSRRYLVKGLIPNEGLSVVWGPPKCGKSFFVFDLTMHVTLGWEYRGRRVNQGPIAYVACEGADGFRARIEAFRQAKLADEVPEIPFHLIPSRLDLVGEYQILINDITAQLAGVQPVAVVLDTLNRSLAGSENSDEDMSAYVQAADAIREAFNCVVIVVHHCGIEGTRPRGHTSLTGAADGQIAVKRGKDGGDITARVEWLKDGLEGDEVISQLEQIEVGIDDDGEPITSCVVVPAESRGYRDSGSRITGAAKIALDQLRSAIHDAGKKPVIGGYSPHVPAGVKTVSTKFWRDYCKSAGLTEGDTPEAFKKAFQRARTKLQSAEYIGIWEGEVWLTEPGTDRDQ
jgi:hypothetical protein